MASYNPPYDVAVHPRFEDTAFDELPKWLQNRIERYSVSSENVEEDLPEQEPVKGTPEPAEEPNPFPTKTDEEDEDDEDLDESGDAMPVDVDFPHHKGGGYYVLSDGRVVRGEDDAIEEQSKL